MATKTSSKTAARKPAASAAGRKTTAPQKPGDVGPKAKVPKKGPAAPAESTAPAKQLKSQPEKPDVSGHATPHAETVSLIDRKRPAKKSQDGETKTKRTVLPPISRIRASLEATSKPPPAHVPSPEPLPPEPAEQPPAEVTLTPAEVEAGPQQKILLIKPPIVVKQFANELGLKPHQLIAELMTHNIFANINQTIEPDIAAKIAENQFVRRDSKDARRSWRSRRDYAAHRRVQRRSQWPHDYVYRYAGARRVHGYARAWRECHRHRCAGGCGRRRHHAANGRSDKSRQGRAACEDHGRRQQDGSPRREPRSC